MSDQHTNSKPQWITWMLVSLGLSLLGGLLLIGIPGALILESIAWAYNTLGLQPLILEGDWVWPVAIVISLLWPLPITPVLLLLHCNWPGLSAFVRWLISLVVSLLVTLSLTFLLMLT